ncbi:hypothetical protein RSOLAG22IIIB_10865 [Rhizoctonia solani]|uniref:RBR-type E3 ubiquitin transferase n=1 Tax=Rhizoctonia solani TaxID=456999 RepID=A0A0K6G4S3_9AGAM|nr:hypothetical protein RSOLAG22IIIB_10865 [Rhizoctonia solani]
MSSLTLVLEDPENVFAGLVALPPSPDGAFLSRSRVTYRGPNTYRNKRKDVTLDQKVLSAPVVCQICLENESLVSSTARCSHEPVICAPCLGQYLVHAVQADGLTTLTCPAVKCEEVLEYGEVVQYIAEDAECLDRFNTLLMQRELERNPKFRWCTDPKCGQGQIHNEKGPIVTCDYCHTLSCFVHRVPWHHGLTCEQYTLKQEAQANNQYLTTYTKRCPNPACGLAIEKSYGCDHMTCRCRHKFCWTCMADYAPILREGNHHHNPTCRHYSANGANANARRRRRRPRRAGRGNRGRLVAMARGLKNKIVRLISSVRRIPFRAT